MINKDRVKAEKQPQYKCCVNIFITVIALSVSDKGEVNLSVSAHFSANLFAHFIVCSLTAVICVCQNWAFSNFEYIQRYILRVILIRPAHLGVSCSLFSQL